MSRLIPKPNQSGWINESEIAEIYRNGNCTVIIKKDKTMILELDEELTWWDEIANALDYIN